MNSNRKSLLLLLAIPILGLIGYGAWKNSTHMSAHGAARKIVFYQDSMHPWIKSEQPGKCTICAMDLTPIYEGQKGLEVGENLVALSSNSITVLHVQAEEIKRQSLGRVLRVAGTLDAIEARKAIISAPAPCRIQSLAVEYAGVEVEQGQSVITLFSPELVQKRSYLRALGGIQEGMKEGAKEERSPEMKRADPYSSTLIAPISGIVVERNVSQGQYVTEGEKLLTIVDASRLWFRFDVYQRQLPWFKLGQTIDVAVEGLPGKVFTAVIAFLEPTLNEAARTLKVRAEVKNPVVATNGHPQRLLRFGMYAEGRVHGEVPNVLAVPRTAILFPGGAAYAYVDRGNGAYERRRVKVGRQGDELWEILEGLEEGDRVVTSGNVLLDAQAQFNQGDRADAAAQDMASGGAAAGPLHPEEGVGLSADSMGAESMTAARDSLSPAGQNSPRKTPSHRETDVARLAIRDQLQVTRAAAMSETHGPATATGKLASDLPPQAASVSAPGQESLSNDVVKASRSSTNSALNHREATQGLMAARDQLWLMRAAAIAEANRLKAETTPSSAETQSSALAAFVALADGLSQALAADNLGKANQCLTNLAGTLAALQKELGAAHRWSAPLQRVAAAKCSLASDLADARRQFLPFSTALVEWVKQLRKEAPGFSGLKIYHCPMAPKPGLWFQSKGPLANPFYGAEMLRCGEEVKGESAAASASTAHAP